jgi:uncharacterized membrane protein YdjX (TVP38/TMEM64 family)
MIAMRLMPGSPNAIYNLVLPHIKSIGLSHVLVGVAVGQAPYNFFITNAGKMIGQIKSKNEIFTRETTYLFLGLSVLFLIPPTTKILIGKFF